jgi:hypothetical protein
MIEVRDVLAHFARRPARTWTRVRLGLCLLFFKDGVQAKTDGRFFILAIKTTTNMVF